MTDWDLVAALRADIQRMSNTRSVGCWSLDELEAALVGRDVLEGPYVRDLPDGRRQFYAFYRHEAASS